MRPKCRAIRATWFETGRFAALLTMRVGDRGTARSVLILRSAHRCRVYPTSALAAQVGYSRLAWARLEGWPQDWCLLPSFETLAPQDEGQLARGSQPSRAITPP